MSSPFRRKAVSTKTTYEQTEAQWMVDGRVFDVNVELVCTDGPNQGKHKLADGISTWSQLEYVDVGGSSSTSIQTGKTIWVDATFGNDATGLADRMDKPFKTLNAAKSAGSANHTIRVRPGSYDERVVLNDVNWHFELGSIIDYTGTSTGQIFGDDLANPANCKVTGWGIFKHSGLPDLDDPTDDAGPYNGVVGSINENSDWYFECLRIDGIQQHNVGTGGLVIDSGKFTFKVKECLTSSIYDALLIGGDVVGSATGSGEIERIVTTDVADNAIEWQSGAMMNIRVGSIEHGNTDVASINGIGRFGTVHCDKITGGQVDIGPGTLSGCEVLLNNTNPDPNSYPLVIRSSGGVSGRLIDCMVRQMIEGQPAVLVAANGSSIDKCVIVAGEGASESITATGPVNINAFHSVIFKPVSPNVTVRGTLHMDDGPAVESDVPRANADGTWSWSA